MLLSLSLYLLHHCQPSSFPGHQATEVMLLTALEEKIALLLSVLQPRKKTKRNW